MIMIMIMITVEPGPLRALLRHWHLPYPGKKSCGRPWV